LWLSGSGRPGDPRVVQAAHPQLPERYAYADDEAASVLVASRFRTGFHRLIPGPWVVLGAPGRGRSELASDCCCSRERPRTVRWLTLIAAPRSVTGPLTL
jgi:hypothetical protein